MLPTPYGRIGFQWWYYTHAFLSLQFDNNELPIETTVKILNNALLKLFNEMMFPSLSVGLTCQVEVGNIGLSRKLLLLNDEEVNNDEDRNEDNDLPWDDFTLVTLILQLRYLSFFSFLIYLLIYLSSESLSRKYGQLSMAVQNRFVVTVSFHNKKLNLL